MQVTAKTQPKAASRGLKGLKKKRRIQVLLLAAAALFAATVLVIYAMKDGANFFRSPTEVHALPPPETEVFRLGGLVKVGSIIQRDGMHFDFVITDGAEEVAVSYIGKDPRPDLFKEGTGTIATGQMRAERFEATVLLAKHDEKYMPREVVNSLKDQGLYQQPES